MHVNDTGVSTGAQKAHFPQYIGEFAVFWAQLGLDGESTVRKKLKL